jgi:hypothetical protein
MPVEAPFTQQQLDEMAHAASATEERVGLRFSVFVGGSDGVEPGAFAERLLSALGDDAPRSVVILVDPSARRVEVVTGHEASHLLDDRACALAASSMASSLTDGDIVGGVLTGLRLLGDSAFWRAASQ